MAAAADVNFWSYRLDPRGRSLWRGRELVPLSPYEYKEPHLLVRRPDRVFSEGRPHPRRRGRHRGRDNSLEKLVSKPAPPGHGDWLLTVEPLLRAWQAEDGWAPALAVVHLRAR